MAYRTPISKKTRFDVFKRDLFKCQYCGNTPPSIILEVDHIIPVSKKGTNDIDNLTTSCFDCNRGKSNRELNTLPQTTEEKTKHIEEKEAQYLAYKKLLQKVKKRLNSEIELIENLYTDYFPGYEFNDRFKFGSLKNFIEQIGYNEVEDSLRKACSKIYDEQGAIKYFCGICWNKIREGGKNG